VIRLAVPPVGAAEIDAVVAVLRSGQFVQGARVRAFEAMVAEQARAKHAIAVSSGTAALHLALLAVGIGPADRVAVPAFSWPATANSVVLCGAEPVFVDIDPVTYNLDPAHLERVLVEDRRIKAIMPVHAFGGMADMPTIMDLAARFDAVVIEDAACALGAAMMQRAAGAWGRVGCFSFHPRKIVTTGEGGAIVTDDDDVQRRLRRLRNHGIDPSAHGVDFVTAGFNYRLTEFQAALGIPQMERLADIVRQRQALASYYATLLAETEIVVPRSSAPEAHTFQSYVVLLPSWAAGRRDRVLERLRAADIEATIGTYHIPATTYFRERHGAVASAFPVAESVSGRAVSLPLHLQLTKDDQSHVVRELLSALDAVR